MAVLDGSLRFSLTFSMLNDSNNDNPTPAQRLFGLPPLIADNTRLLVLGSFPGIASLTQQQYYAHRQNQFWKIWQAIFPLGPCANPYVDPCADPFRMGAAATAGTDNYEQRTHWLLQQGVGVWDVYASCERIGSLDSAIRAPQVNDFAALRQRCPQLRAIAHNGGESFRHAKYTAALGLPIYKLPSTSPANARWSFERKLAAWREVAAAVGLLA